MHLLILDAIFKVVKNLNSEKQATIASISKTTWREKWYQTFKTATKEFIENKLLNKEKQGKYLKMIALFTLSKCSCGSAI